MTASKLQGILPWDLALACDGLAALERLGPERARGFTDLDDDGLHWHRNPLADIEAFGRVGLVGRDAGGWHLQPMGESVLRLVCGCSNLALGVSTQDRGLIHRALAITDADALRRRWAAIHPGHPEPRHAVEPAAALGAPWDWTGTAVARMPGHIQARMEAEGKALLRWILDQPAPPALHHAAARLRFGPKLVAPTLEWLVQTLVLAPVFDPDDGLVHLTAGQPAAPVEVDIDLGGWEVDDALQVIPHLAAGLAPRRRDGKLSAKAMDLLGPLMTHLPENRFFDTLATEVRVSRVVSTCERLEIQPLPDDRPDQRDRLAQRLDQPTADLLRPLADALRRTAAPSLKHTADALGLHLRFAHQALVLLRVMDGPSLFPEEIVRRATKHYLGEHPVMMPWVMEDLERLLFDLMLPFGFVRAGRHGMALTPEGRYALGLSDAWPEHPPRDPQPFVVMADHTIVFLAPHPGHELRLAAFAEPQPGPERIGVRFRLTKASVQRGAARGMDADGMLATLAAGSRKPVPEHLAHELRTWAGGVRSCAYGTGTVIAAPDAATATAIVAACRKADRAQVLAGSVVLLDPDTDLDALGKALAKRGIVLGRCLDGDR
ncbi:MAG: Helicase conserved C-terminal domain [Planctomycetota bacterium]